MNPSAFRKNFILKEAEELLIYYFTPVLMSTKDIEIKMQKEINFLERTLFQTTAETVLR